MKFECFYVRFIMQTIAFNILFSVKNLCIFYIKWLSFLRHMPYFDILNIFICVCVCVK